MSPAFVLEECLAHRAQREEQLLQALGEQPRTVPDLARAVYQDLRPDLVRLVQLQVLAGLRKLEREGRAQAVLTPGGTEWQRP